MQAAGGVSEHFLYGFGIVDVGALAVALRVQREGSMTEYLNHVFVAHAAI